MKLTALTVFCSIFLMGAKAQSLNPASPEQLVNTDIPTAQFVPKVAAAPDGGYVIIWVTGLPTGQLKARRYDSSHNPVTGEVTIAASTFISKQVNIEHWKNGKYVISYVENSTLKFHILDELNNVGTGITVSTTVPAEKQDLAIKGDSLAFLYSNSSDKQLYLRGYNLSANAWFNTAIRVSETSNSYIDAPNIIYHNNGRLTAIYHQVIATGCCIAETRIMRKTYTSAFLAEIPEYAILAPGVNSYSGKDMEANGNNNGEVMIASTYAESASVRKLSLWILSSNGSLIVNGSALLNGPYYHWQEGMEVELYDNGDYVIAKSFWNTPNGSIPPNQEEVYVIYGKNYNQSRTAPLQVNSTAPDEQDQPCIAKLPNGGFVVAWSGNGFQGDSRGINVRAFNAVAFPGVAFSTAGNYTVNESGTTATIGVALGTQPSGNVTVDLSSSDLTEGTVSPAQLTFTPANWDQVQNVTVTGVDDTADDGDITFNLVASAAASADAAYAALAAKNQAVLNKDNDASVTMPSAQSFCKTSGMSNVNAIITNVGAAITAVTASSSNQSVIDNSDITVNNLGGDTYEIVINALSNNTTGTAQITLTATDGQFNYTGNFNVTTTGVNLVVNASSNAICTGESVTLSATGGQNISWNNGVVNNVPFTPSATATYTVTADNGAGCTETTTQTITVTTAPSVPTVNASGPLSICGNGSVILTSSSSTGNTWSTGANSQSITVSSTGTYTVSVSNGTCSATSAPVAVTVNPNPAAPVITPNGPTTFCDGGSVILASSQANGNSWSTGVNSQSITASTTNTYTVTYTDANNCVSPATSILITVQSAPNVSAGPDQTVCEGAMVTLLGSGAVSYSWTGGITNGISFPANTQSTFEVTGTGSNGCTNTDQVTIFVNSNPNVSAGPNLTVCNGESVTLNGSGAATYDWDNGAVNGVSFVPTLGTTTYTVTGTNAAGCEAEDQMTVTVNQLPNVSISTIPTFCLSDGSAALTQGMPSGGTYTGAGITGVVFSPSAAGLGIFPVTYTYTDVNGCENTASGTITVDQCLGIDENAFADLLVYPNPTTGVATIEYTGSFTYSIVDAQGRKILEGNASDKAPIDLSAFGDGVYQVLIQTENASASVRMVKN